MPDKFYIVSLHESGVVNIHEGEEGMSSGDLKAEYLKRRFELVSTCGMILWDGVFDGAPLVRNHLIPSASAIRASRCSY